ncbi:MAG TPA: hypothetical protein VFY86_01065 [Nocardioides sp.]|jgi:hypothetical protein|nr:hypothetical protein [uncultured Nocardioides sp.]HEX5985079.1 hypothetical protein [Nocardioides sp.]
MHRFRARRYAAALAALALAASTASCSGSDEGGATPGEAASSTPEASATAAEEPDRSVDPRVRVTRVSGKLKPKDREVLADNIGKVVIGYFEDAFTGGEYPRSSFGDAFATFSQGAARQADADRDLLTNRVLGPTTQGIEVRRQTAYLSVLAPYRVAAGVTARVHLRYVADQGDEPAQRVDVKGRLMLTRKESGGWQIFGYDLTRNARTVGEESR